MSLPKMTPWVELHGQETYADIVTGCRVFGVVTPAVCISVAPSGVEQFVGLVTDSPDVHVVPGIGTNAALNGRIDSLDGWQTIAAAVRRALEITGANTVVFEHELAVRPYERGTYTPDWAAFAACLALLPPGITYFWHPGIFTSDAEEQPRQVELLRRVVAALPGVTFTSSGWWGRNHPASPLAQVQQSMTAAIGPCVALVDCELDWPHGWYASQVPGVVRDCPLNTLVYPGAAGFSSAAQTIARGMYADAVLRLAHAEVEKRQTGEYLQLAQTTVGTYRQRITQAKDILSIEVE